MHQIKNKRELVQVMVKLRNALESRSARWIFLVSVALLGGCSTPSGFNTGAEDVRDFESLKLDSLMPPPALVVLKEGGLRKVEMSWPAPNTYVYRYRIERAEAVGGPFAFLANVDPALRRFVDGETQQTHLKEDTTYFYRLIAVKNRRGPRSLPSPVLSSTTAPPPQPVTALTVKATGSRTNTLNWRPAGGVGISSYRIERAVADEPEKFLPVGTTKESTFTDGGTAASSLRDSTPYLYRVVTVNEVGSYSPPSESSTVTTFPPPAAVSNFSAITGSVRCAPLQWNPSPEADVVGYHLYCARAAESEFQKLTEVKGRDSVRYTDGGGNPGTLEDEGLYLYKIRAVNAVGAESPDSEVVRVVTRPVPPEINDVIVASGMPREAVLNWTLSADNTVEGYEIWRTLQDADDWQQIKMIENNKISRYLDRGGEEDLAKLGRLLDGTGYVYRVISYNTGGVRSSASAPAMAVTKFAPVKPAGLTASSGLAGVVQLSWQPNPEADIKCYEIEVSAKESRGFKTLCTVNAGNAEQMKAREESLNVSVVRYYRIKAVAADRLESAWSEVVSGVTKALPDAPSGLQRSAETNPLTLSWTPPRQQDIDHYNIWSKRLIGWKQIASPKACEYQITADELAQISAVAVSAVDVDGLESGKSETLKLEVIQKQ